MKFTVAYDVVSDLASHPARGAWIEMVAAVVVVVVKAVAPRKGCVD